MAWLSGKQWDLSQLTLQPENILSPEPVVDDTGREGLGLAQLAWGVGEKDILMSCDCKGLMLRAGLGGEPTRPHHGLLVSRTTRLNSYLKLQS